MNMCLMGVPGEENRRDCEEAFFKEIRSEDLPELNKNMIPQIEHVYKGLNRIIFFKSHLIKYHTESKEPWG